MLLLLPVACTPSPDSADDTGPRTDTGEPDDTDDTADTGDSMDTVDADDLHGTLPAESFPAPEFSATNRDGGARSREHLTGHPSVIWFYPAANTGG